MYDGLVKRVRQVAEEVCEDYDVDPYNAEQRCLVIEEVADAIELQQKLLNGLEADNESLCKTIDLYRELLGGHPDPRGEDGEPGVKCIDCQRDCQMIGLDMPACMAYEPTKEE